MSSTPPTIPPDIAASSQPDWGGFLNAAIVSFLSNVDSLAEGSRNPLTTVFADIAAAVVETTIAIFSYVGERVGEGTAEWEAQAGPQILKAAATALSDYFGESISPSQLSPGRSGDQRFRFAEQLGRLTLEHMFSAFTAPSTIRPEDGIENAERLIGFNIATALESFLGQNVVLGPIGRLLPNFADLDDVLSANLGLGRANRRVMGPLLKTLIVDPLTWDLNRRFAPARFSVSELVRLERRRALEPGEYQEQMSWHGYDQRKASKLLGILTTIPSTEDISKMLELGLLDDVRARALFEAQGFSEDGAAAMLALAKEERVRSINTAIEGVARDMYRDRQIDDGELRSILVSAGRAPGEVDALLGLAGLERSRPRPLPRGDVEEGFRKGLIPLSRLREYYAQFGFSLEDQVLLEELAVADRLEAEAREEREKLKAGGLDFRQVPAAQLERAYIEGRIGSARLREFYVARGYREEDIALLMENAGVRKTAFDRERALELERAKSPDFLELPRGTIEEAFFRDVIGADRLREWYAASGLSPGDVDVALRVARDRKAEREERLEEELKRANRPDFLELPRAVMEEAFYRGIVTEGRLRDWYEGRGFRASEIPILLELARQKKAERTPARP